MERARLVTDGWSRERLGDLDGALLARVGAGYRSALDALYPRHAAVLLGYLLQIAPTRELAEEILQDTFVAAWQGATRFQSRSSVRTWLFGIARRQAHNALRRRSLILDDAAALDLLPSDEPEPEAAALLNAERETVAAAVARLAATQREILVLAFVHELSYAEMAAVLDVPVGTVKSRLSNAKHLLRRTLASAETEG